MTFWFPFAYVYKSDYNTDVLHHRTISYEVWKNRQQRSERSLNPRTDILSVLTIRQIERYLRHVDRTNWDKGCWIYIFKGREQYPKFGPFLAHRIAYSLYKGAIPDGLTVYHNCGVRWCQNPEHLEAITLDEARRRYAQSYRQSG